MVGTCVVETGQYWFLSSDQIVILAAADPRIRYNVVYLVLREGVGTQLVYPVIVRSRVGGPEPLTSDPFENCGCVWLTEFNWVRKNGQYFESNGMLLCMRLHIV